jgi:hypothetical protein
MPTTSDHDDKSKSHDRPDGEDRVIGRPYSRVETEVLEILERKDRPLSFSEHVRRKAARARRQRLERATWQLRRARTEAGPGTFLVASLVLALFAYFLRDVSALLASILALASVACLFWPIIMRFRHPAGSSNKRWRGRDMDYYSPSAEPPRWVRNLQDRFRRPPRP